MIKQSVIVVVVASAVHLFYHYQKAATTLANTTVLLPTEPHPALNWYLTTGSNNNSTTDAPTTTPLVTIENILPSQLLSAALSEIQSSITMKTITQNNGSPYVVKPSCTLARDGGACGDERWIDFTHEDALRYHDDYKLQNTPNTPENPLAIEKDLMEQVILHIAKYDLVHVLPHYVSKHVKGVSWRILISTTGHNHNVFHFDSDEAMDYAIQDVPLITPLLSTVTYLSSGEPTLILDTSQLSNDTIYHPTKAYVSMPKKNKHIAFDSRLFHGSSGPLFVGKEEGDVRIAIGTNFHTQRSLETIYSKRHRLMQQYVHRPLEVRSEESTPPIDMRERTTTREHEPVIKSSWNTDDNNTGDPLRTNWTSFQIKTNHQGRSFFASDRYKKSNITMRLPIDWILAQARHDPGCTLGITLERSDFNVSHDKNENFRPKPKNRNKESKLVAREMLIKRCEIFPNDSLSMNPPLNVNVCSQLLGK
jgi:hypothetical protein